MDNMSSVLYFLTASCTHHMFTDQEHTMMSFLTPPPPQPKLPEGVPGVYCKHMVQNHPADQVPLTLTNKQTFNPRCHGAMYPCRTEKYNPPHSSPNSLRLGELKADDVENLLSRLALVVLCPFPHLHPDILLS